ncbi:hypothetical protein BDV34DRAFT_201343 [Aspergillus parasiticus]|uniref:Uncharacterized protein n=1 Tax=Aspergillus parasiticus TaxID=5067 RepID=A0A5N6DB47_ASPPA|nr:hypothetical protein BDV34DRAFT_201343 [Aspergillus parasiticus]
MRGCLIYTRLWQKVDTGRGAIKRLVILSLSPDWSELRSGSMNVTKLNDWIEIMPGPVQAAIQALRSAAFHHTVSAHCRTS